MKDSTFYCEGSHDLPAGVWKVRQLKTDKNEYRCVRITGSQSGTNAEDFDVGYVMRQCALQFEQRREMGPRFRNGQDAELGPRRLRSRVLAR